MSLYLGDYQAAHEYARENLEIRRTFSVEPEEAWGLYDLGKVALIQGHLEQAMQYFSDGLRTHRKFQNKHGICHCLSHLGIATVHAGDIQGGLALLEESQETHTGYENQNDTCVIINMFYQGQAVQLLRDYTRSMALMSENLKQVWNNYSLPEIPPRLEGLAAGALGLGKYTFCATLLGAANQKRQEMETPIYPVDRPAYDESLSTLREMISEAEFNQAWQVGVTMTMDEIVTYALAAHNE
jgi:tetratricopeptide (TPR) repeat protein